MRAQNGAPASLQPCWQFAQGITVSQQRRCDKGQHMQNFHACKSVLDYNAVPIKCGCVRYESLNISPWKFWHFLENSIEWTAQTRCFFTILDMNKTWTGRTTFLRVKCEGTKCEVAYRVNDFPSSPLCWWRNRAKPILPETEELDISPSFDANLCCLVHSNQLVFFCYLEITLIVTFWSCWTFTGSPGVGAFRITLYSLGAFTCPRCLPYDNGLFAVFMQPLAATDVSCWR